MLYLFDLDGTLISPYMENPDKAYHQWAVLPGRAAKLSELRMNGHHVAIVTNQGGVGAGYVGGLDWVRKISDVVQQLGGEAIIEQVLVSFSTVSARAKPNRLMLDEARFYWPDLTDQDVLMVGDRPEDSQAAANAGVPFQWAHEFFGDPTP